MRGPQGEFIKYKARLVACGYTQFEGIDFFEIYASVMYTKSFRILLVIYNFYQEMRMEHCDLKQAFANVQLEETVYVHQVKGMEKRGQEGKMLLPKKALYGTKQAAHALQKCITQQFLDEGGRRNLKDECIFIFGEGEKICIIGTHVDDIFPLYNEEGRKIRDRVFKQLEQKMKEENKGEIKYALDTCIERNVERGTLRISQENYIRNVIEEFKFEEAKGKHTPGPTCDITAADIPTTQEEKEKADLLQIRSAIGKSWWAALISRPDIICALHKCAAWQNIPSQKLWKHILWIIRYLKNTLTHAIVLLVVMHLLLLHQRQGAE